MRPIRLELEGFTAFREKTEVDFEGSDLFVLCGPTGSGKSSLIDAMTFALYGSVPRYGDPKLVLPVISQGKQEARVRFDFAVDGKPYTAVRIVRRVKRGATWGATTKEARLECGEDVLAGKASELDERIRALFGMSFQQFTTCVVLPQGEFARFLHETPAIRQDLLKELLGVRLYDRMGRLARERASEARQRTTLLEEQLGELSGATKEAKREADARVKRLVKLRKAIEKGQRELDALASQHKGKSNAAEGESKSAALLAKVEVPPGIQAIAADQTRAAEALAEKTAACEAAEVRLADANAALERLPEADPLRDLQRAYAQRDEERERLEAAQPLAASAANQAERANTALLDAKAAYESAQQAVTDLRRAHAAQDLAEGLAPGDPCPVCQRTLEESPHHDTPPGFDEAEEAVENARAAQSRTERAHREAVATSSAAASKVTQLEARVAELGARLDGAPSAEHLAEQLADIAGAKQRVEEERRAADLARKAEREAARQRADAASRLTRAWEEYDALRDAVATLEPPAAEREDLGRSWKTLVEWAQAQAARASEASQALQAEAQALEDQITQKHEALEAECENEGVELDDETPRDAVVDAIARAETEATRIADALERQTDLTRKRDEAKQSAAVAGSLGRHLSANAFERWLLQEAFEDLVATGSEKLRELSSGDYSFALDERLVFEIVDHRNADEIRSARTLSGGETFLASLALALALADQVVGLAADGASRLESMFLDEGFGTLDPDTLDTVATTIEGLGAQGRTVGLVTHVRELADRIPVQYQVQKGPTTASVERIVP